MAPSAQSVACIRRCAELGRHAIERAKPLLPPGTSVASLRQVVVQALLRALERVGFDIDQVEEAARIEIWCATHQWLASVDSGWRDERVSLEQLGPDVPGHTADLQRELLLRASRAFVTEAALWSRQTCTKDAAVVLETTIEQLPEQHQVVVGLFHLEELTFGEIAEVLDLRPNEVLRLHGEASQAILSALGRAAADQTRTLLGKKCPPSYPGAFRSPDPEAGSP